MDVLPDTKLAVIDWIRAHPDLPAGTTVAGAVPDDLATSLPLVVAFRPPGPPPLMWAAWDRALINIQVWADTEHAAREMASTVLGILHEAPGHTVTGIVIQAVTDLQGAGDLADLGYPDLSRQVSSVTVTARAA